jgi:hypothetical protein
VLDTQTLGSFGVLAFAAPGGGVIRDVWGVSFGVWDALFR